MKKLMLVIIVMCTAVMGGVESIVLYKEKCVGCHGVNAKKKAFGKSDVIGDWNTAKIVEALNGYKAGSRSMHGMGHLHNGPLSSFSTEDIKAVAAYITSLK